MRLKQENPRGRHHVKAMASVWYSLERLGSGWKRLWERTEAALGLLGSGRSVAGASLRLLGDGLKAVSGQTDGETSGGAVGFSVQATKSRQKPRRRLEKRLECPSKLLKIQAKT